MFNRPFFVYILSISLAVLVVLGFVTVYDYYSYPNYHKVRLGMTLDEVDRIVTGSGSDSYPNELGGCTNYYFTPEPGTLVVVYDANRRVLEKKIRRD